MRHLWDGFLSLLSAVATVSMCGVPIWFTYRSIIIGIAPQWAWVPIIALTGVTVLMTFAFLRKAADGVSPSRERRRR